MKFIKPMILLAVFGCYQVADTFRIEEMFSLQSPVILKLPLIFIGLVYVLTIKLRKSPFDLSMSHHGHQELVKGITTELTGICMAMVEVAHWFDTVFALGFVYIFFIYANPWSNLIALAACLIIYFFEIVIDNSFARTKWKTALETSWGVTAVFGGLNLLILSMLK